MSDAPAAPTAGRRVRAGWRWLRARWYRRLLLDALIVIALFWGIGRWQSRHLLDDATRAPDFALVDLDGATHALADYRGQTVVLVFWAPWCTVCSLESDNWARIQAWRSDVRVLSVACSYQSRAEVAEFVGDDREAYPVLLGNDAVQRAYRVDAFPTHYIIDPDGRVAWQGQGYSPTVALWLRLL